MSGLQYYVVDAFTTEIGKGNPAAVVIFTEGDPRSESTTFQQTIAKEFNFQETAFLQRIPVALSPKYSLRWFTAKGIEVVLCGHATIAASHALFTTIHQFEKSNRIEFETLSGTLSSEKEFNGAISLDFPADNSLRLPTSEEEKVIIDALAAIPSLSRNGTTASFKHILVGGLGCVIEVDESIRLKGLDMNMDNFVSSSSTIVNENLTLI